MSSDQSRGTDQVFRTCWCWGAARPEAADSDGTAQGWPQGLTHERHIQLSPCPCDLQKQRPRPFTPHHQLVIKSLLRPQEEPRPRTYLSISRSSPFLLSPPLTYSHEQGGGRNVTNVVQWCRSAVRYRRADLWLQMQTYIHPKALQFWQAWVGSTEI